MPCMSPRAGHSSHSDRILANKACQKCVSRCLKRVCSAQARLGRTHRMGMRVEGSLFSHEETRSLSERRSYCERWKSGNSCEPAGPVTSSTTGPSPRFDGQLKPEELTALTLSIDRPNDGSEHGAVRLKLEPKAALTCAPRRFGRDKAWPELREAPVWARGSRDSLRC